MKRALAMALGAVMVAGSAAPATAASHIDFSGYYRVMYMNEVNTGYGRESESFTDSYFQDRLQLDLTFSPTDEISIYWRLRGPGSYQRWGTGTSGKQLTTKFIYGEIKQDWGTVLVGRMSDDLDCAGLCAFGYMPSTVPVFTNVGPFDRADIMDGIRYSYDWDNGFSILAQYVKLDNNGQHGGGIWYDDALNGDSDQDYDRIQAQVAYAWDGGGAALHAFYDRNASSNPETTQGWGPWSIVDTFGQSFNKIEMWGLNPAIMHTWGDFSVHFEGMAMWGQMQYLADRDVDGKHFRDVDGEGYGAYLDFDYNYGPGNATLAGWWVSGTGLDEMYDRDGEFTDRGKSKSIADIVGGNFYPLLVAYNGANVNPGENRYYGNAGRHLSGIGFANNGYENYVRDGYQSFTRAGGEYRFTYTDAGGNDIDVYRDANPFLNAPTLFANIGVDAGNTKNNNAALVRAFHNVATNDLGRTRTMSFNNDTDANHWAIALTGNHAFTDDITMHYGLAYLALNKPNYRVATSGALVDTGAGALAWNPNSIGFTTQDKDLGFEIDLGFTFQLLDNLKFTSAFGYMFNGDAYKSLKGYNRIQGPGGTATALGEGDRVRAVWEDADDSYVWFNSLTFAF